MLVSQRTLVSILNVNIYLRVVHFEYIIFANCLKGCVPTITQPNAFHYRNICLCEKDCSFSTTVKGKQNLGHMARGML